MSYVSRSEAREQGCPACKAAPGERCVGARGKARESVHRERIEATANLTGKAAVPTLSLNGSDLIDVTGVVVGKLVGLEIDLTGDPWEGYQRGGEGEPTEGERRGAVVQAVSPNPNVLTLGEGLGEPTEDGSRLFDAPDTVREVFDFYCATVPGKANSRLTQQTRKLIKRAMEERPVDQLKTAIRGLATSDYHRTNGYLALNYAIGKTKQTETVGDRIDMMAAKAPTHVVHADGRSSLNELLASVSPEVRSLVLEDVAQVRRMHQNTTHGPTLRLGNQALERLRGKPARIEPIIGEDGKLTGWRRVGS